MNNLDAFPSLLEVVVMLPIEHGKQNQESINGLIQSLGLDGLDSESHFDPKNDDIADWFSGSPDWVRRS